MWMINEVGIMIVENLIELPENIIRATNKLSKLRGGFISSFKTLYKPKVTVSPLWFTLYEDGVALLTSQNKGSVFKEIPHGDINSIRIITYDADTILMDLISKDIFKKDISMKVPNIDIAKLKANLASLNYSVIYE
jgi:hypothetical protein